MRRTGVCINCAEKIAALILQSGPEELVVEPCSGASRTRPGPRRVHNARTILRDLRKPDIGKKSGHASMCLRSKRYCGWDHSLLMI
jgi:hypothetical protein